MDYWDYIQALMKHGSNPAGFFGGTINDLYNQLYDESHGSTRYWLSKVPFYGWLRRETDNARKAQDSYDKTGIDPAYIDRISGTGSVGPGSVLGKASRMARSLSDVYTPEIMENVQSRMNNAYW